MFTPSPKFLVTVNNDVADIDAEAEDDAFFVHDTAVSFDHLALNGDSASDSLDDALKVRQQPSPVVLTIRPPWAAMVVRVFGQP